MCAPTGGVAGELRVSGGGARRFWLAVGGAVVCLGVFRVTGDGGPGSSCPTGGVLGRLRVAGDGPVYVTNLCYIFMTYYITYEYNI